MQITAEKKLYIRKYIANIGLRKYACTGVVIKIKNLHSCRTRIVCVAVVLRSYCLGSTRVLLVSYSCLTRLAHVLFVTHWCRLCRTRVAHV